MSPCTAKLSAFRNKQVGKYVAPPRPQVQHLCRVLTWYPVESSPSRCSPRRRLRNSRATVACLAPRMLSRCVAARRRDRVQLTPFTLYMSLDDGYRVLGHHRFWVVGMLGSLVNRCCFGLGNCFVYSLVVSGVWGITLCFVLGYQPARRK